ncbi:MAG: ComEC/Rec2 family competence protein [Patescibacteria group bacterium]|nr:ComEC/Rec2 family competence protein [bacterium]MDZ4241118.1 ComEC/Rec2 family competence protein [Patescibacteria group bacterium]
MKGLAAGLYSLFFGFVGGVFLRSFVSLDIYSICFFFLISFYLFVYFFFLKKTRGKIFVPLASLAVFFLAFAFGSLRFHFAVPQERFTDFVSERISVSGIIVDEPREGDTTARIILLAQNINGTEIPANFSKKNKILVTTDPYQSFQYGDTVFLLGILEKPKSFENEYGITFDYVSYLKKDGILYTIKNVQIQSVSPSASFSLRRELLAMKKTFTQSLIRTLPEPHASLVAGMLLGEKQSIPKDVEDEFRKTGIIHIVVLSGYNISLVVLASLWLFSSFLPRTIAYVLASTFVLLFVSMVGFEASIVRAALMALVVILGKLLYRHAAPVRLLCLVAFLMILFNPYTAAFDPSFQLSFLATLGLIAISPLIEKYFSKIPAQFKEIAVATIATQLLVLPLIVYRGGEFPLMAFPVNLLVLPLTPLIMFSGFVTACVGLFSPVLAAPFSLFTSIISSYVFAVAHFFSNLPFSVAVIHLSGFVTAVLYIFIFLFLFRRARSV